MPDPARRGVELRRADLAERERLAAGFAGAETLVSSAALLSLGNRSWEDHERTNVEGTRNVIEAAAVARRERAPAIERAHLGSWSAQTWECSRDVQSATFPGPGSRGIARSRRRGALRPYARERAPRHGPRA